MKKSLLLLCSILSPLSSGFSQGSLTPPAGAPAPMMKTLDQIASTGIAINGTNTPGDTSNQFIISAPGSYFLAGNINGVAGKNGIRINSDSVTVDLNGFDVNGSGAGAFSGIVILGTPRSGVTIRNGFVRNWGLNGIDVSFADNCHVENAAAKNNGSYGIAVGENSTVRSCRASANAAGGIATTANCSVANCVAELSSGSNSYGIVIGTGSVAANCAVLQNSGASGGGIFTGQYCKLVNCTASLNNGTNGFGIKLGNFSSAISCDCSGNNGTGVIGISAGNHDLISDCHVSDNSTDGIKAGSSCTIQSNHVSNNHGSGIHTTGGSNKIDNNSVIGNDVKGILVDGTLSLIIRNTATQNSGGNYSTAAGNSNAEVITGATNFTNTDPSANFSY